ncbi:MAG: GvpL/GvpF family gas vesicle protein [Candidatus Jettenia caeni]|nr:MAG: GvpL/GvpF family gas vesicle protein [Candidatus Jettenia caeni]
MYQYLYGITKAFRRPIQDILGIENIRVRALPYREITALISEVTMAKIPISNENVLRHALVIEILQKEQTVLPMRFSSVFKSGKEVFEFLNNRYAMFIADLEQLHNTFEMGLRIIMRSSDVRNAQSVQSDISGNVSKRNQANAPQSYRFGKNSLSSGTAYLERQRAYYTVLDENKTSVQEIVSTCHAQFEGIYTKSQWDKGFSFLPGISLNYLIHRDFLSEFRIRFYDLVASLKEFRFLYSGPWPPYHFVSGDGG